MKKELFIKAIEKYHSSVVRHLAKRDVDADMAEDAVQEMFVSVLSNKSYDSLEYDAIDNRVFSFFKSAARYKLKDTLLKQENDNQTFVTIDNWNEEEKQDREARRTFEKAEQECPYCHDGVLNMYKACGECGTIIGQGRGVHEHISIDEADLASLPDLDLTIDVQNAIAALDPLEQLIIRQHAMGNDTLEGLANIHGMSGDSMYRVYVKAKRKLQAALIEYAV